MLEDICVGYWTGQHDRLFRVELASWLRVSCGPLKHLRSLFVELCKLMHWDEMAGEIHAKRPNRAGTRRASSTALTAPRLPTVMLTSHSVNLDKRALRRLALPAHMSKRQSTGEWKKHTFAVESSKTKQNAGYQSGRSKWPFLWWWLTKKLFLSMLVEKSGGMPCWRTTSKTYAGVQLCSQGTRIWYFWEKVLFLLCTLFDFFVQSAI